MSHPSNGQRLAGPGTELGSVLSEAVRRGVDVRGLIWRSHPDQEGYEEQENAHVAKVVNEAGGEVLPDERVRRFGSHHQKLVVIRRAGREDLDVAFVGGIDLCHGRGDGGIIKADGVALAQADVVEAGPGRVEQVGLVRPRGHGVIVEGGCDRGYDTESSAAPHTSCCSCL